MKTQLFAVATALLKKCTNARSRHWGVPLVDLRNTGTQYASMQTPMQLARQSADEKQCCKDGNT